MPSSPRGYGSTSSPPRGRSRGGGTGGSTTTQRIVSNPIGAGSLSAGGSETFAHFSLGYEGQTPHGDGVLGENSSTNTMDARLSCNNASFEELPDEKSNLSVSAPEAEESMQSVASKVRFSEAWGWGGRGGERGSEEDSFFYFFGPPTHVTTDCGGHSTHTRTYAFCGTCF